MRLKIKVVEFAYNSEPVLEDVSLHVEDGEVKSKVIKKIDFPTH